MALTDGQKTARDQLQRIADTDRSPLHIIEIEEGENSGGFLTIYITIDCTHYERVEGGLPLHANEGIRLLVPADFPFNPPIASTVHRRFHGFPHVQWGHQLCLYLSPDIQWNPSQGMRGFIAQLDGWLRRGARNELDHPEGPLHPPVAYAVSSTSICVNADTPSPAQWPWFGAAILTQSKPGLFEVNSWESAYHFQEDKLFAPTVLLDFELPFEYPETVDTLLFYLESKGIEKSCFLAHLILTSEYIADNTPLYIGIGTPSRGIAGDIKQRQQHLTFWEIEAHDVIALRNAFLACKASNNYQGQDAPEEIKRLIQSTFNILFQWCKTACVRWCYVIENRPEIVTQRDKDSAMDWFRGKRVALWGCGAIGGLIAEHLARAGVAQLSLYDKARVTPGLLVRQNYLTSDVNDAKAAALARRIQQIAPHTIVRVKTENIISETLTRSNWHTGIDVVIDATASLRVRAKLESVLKGGVSQIPIASVMVSADVQYGVAVTIPAGFRAGPLDVLQRLGLAAMKRKWLKDWTEAFWPSDPVQGLRQPEPGCSAPTFVGSHADVAELSARALNIFAQAFAEQGDDASGFLFSQTPEHREHNFKFRPDICWTADGLDFRMSQHAWRDMIGWIRTGARERSINYETGGLLFGYFDETLGIVWVNNVSGPPQDSKFSEEHFICGTDGIEDLCKGYKKQTHEIVRCIGTWHSHPVSPAKPSLMDYEAINSIFASTHGDGFHQLMIIVGYAAKQQPQIGAYMFERRELASQQAEINRARGGVTIPPPVAGLNKKIGLSLSGGGSRAVAFHLGTLRALEDLKLLDEVNIISGVSGGSVMTGLIGYTDAPFSQIDKNSIEFLRHGLIKPALMKLCHPSHIIPLLLNFTIVKLPVLTINFITCMTNILALFFPKIRNIANIISSYKWPLRCFYSRTHVMADAVSDLIGTQNCNAPTRQDKSIVFNACELRTGTAFRMSNKRFGSWRYGYAPASDLRVADAVMASAAYPPLLPPYDWRITFEKTKNDQVETKTHRVIITDGGVFDNLGVSVMEPGRDPKISEISFDPNIIIVSDAGTGQFTGHGVPISWPDRMIQVVSAIMRKVQDATKKRLYDYVETERIDRFIYIHLGQIDREVILKPANWVNRGNVIDYPVNFSVMSEENIQKLSRRGETITRALVTQYLLTD